MNNTKVTLEGDERIPQLEQEGEERPGQDASLIKEMRLSVLDQLNLLDSKGTGISSGETNEKDEYKIGAMQTEASSLDESANKAMRLSVLDHLNTLNETNEAVADGDMASTPPRGSTAAKAGTSSSAEASFGVMKSSDGKGRLTFFGTPNTGIFSHSHSLETREETNVPSINSKEKTNEESPPPISLQRGSQLQRSSQTSTPGAFHLEGAGSAELGSHFASTFPDSQDQAAANGEPATNTVPADEEAQIQSSDNLQNMPVANMVTEPTSLSQAIQVDQQEEHQNTESVAGKVRETLSRLFAIALLLGVVIVVVVVVVVAMGNRTGIDNNDNNNNSHQEDASTNNYTETPLPTDEPLTMDDYVLSLLPETTVKGILVALDSLGSQNFTAFTPQQLAYQWLLEDPNVTYLTDQRIVQRFALATLFYATNGPSWRRADHWLNYTFHECDWFVSEATSTTSSPDLHNLILLNDTVPDRINSIPCNGDSYEFLRLRENGLEGTLPLELFLLSNLRGLSLEENKLLQGPIPSQIGNLSLLEEVLLFAGELTGTIPTQFGNLSQLKVLHLFINQLTGNIPSQIGQLSDSLIAFSPSSNLITGTVPTQLGALSMLQGFSFQHNAMSGTIPQEVGQFTDLRLLFLARNGFIGSLPAGVWDMTNLEELWITVNGLTGRLMTEIGLLRSLKTIDIGSNPITGSLPSEIGILPNLGIFKASKMGLSGSLPNELGLCTSLSVLLLHLNQFDGQLPSQLGQLTGLYMFNAFGNQFTGSLPTELGRLSNIERNFQLHSGNLTGTIPSQLGLLTRAHTFNLAQNKLTGTLPTELGNLHGTTLLSLFGNQLSGPIPSQFGLLDNHTMPMEFESMKPHDRIITKILLSENALEGAVPSSLGLLWGLQLLEIYNNTRLTGRIPTRLCELGTWSESGGIRVDCERVNCTCSACVCE